MGTRRTRRLLNNKTKSNREEWKKFTVRTLKEYDEIVEEITQLEQEDNPSEELIQEVAQLKERAKEKMRLVSLIKERISDSFTFTDKLKMLKK